MIRVGKATIRYEGGAGDAAGAAGVSRRALEILQTRLAAGGALPPDLVIGQLRVSVRVPAGAPAEAVAGRVAAAVAGRLPGGQGR